MAFSVDDIFCYINVHYVSLSCTNCVLVFLSFETEKFNADHAKAQFSCVSYSVVEDYWLIAAILNAAA